MKIDIESRFLGHSSILVLSCYCENEFYKQRYDGYNLAEAKKLFREYIKQEQKKIFYNISA
jgi:hypothetical protein